MFWKVKTKDGKIHHETLEKWSDLKKEDIISLQFDGIPNIKLPDNMDQYYYAKSASTILGSDKIQIESRYIGFKLGNNIIKVRVGENTQKISIEVE